MLYRIQQVEMGMGYFALCDSRKGKWIAYRKCIMNLMTIQCRTFFLCCSLRFRFVSPQSPWSFIVYENREVYLTKFVRTEGACKRMKGYIFLGKPAQKVSRQGKCILKGNQVITWKGSIYTFLRKSGWLGENTQVKQNPHTGFINKSV